MSPDFLGALEALERERGIDMDVLLEALEAALISAYRRNFGSAQQVEVFIDQEEGAIKVVASKQVVEEVEDESLEISLEDAREVDADAEIGQEIKLEVTPKDFGRIAATTARQVVVQRIREAERGMIYDEFVNREGDIITGVVRRVHGRNVFVDLGRTEAILLPSEQIPREYYRQGERIKTYIVEVKRTTKGPQVVVSRSHPGLIKRLFELEVPEIHEGLVEIKQIAREAGARSKVAVYSRDLNVDPVGACVGPRGSRVQSVVNELKGEKIDIIRWSDETEEMLANSLSPARVLRAVTDQEEKVAQVIVPDDQLSLAIGREGQNARLAAKLTGWKIDIKSESQAADEPELAGDEERWVPAAEPGTDLAADATLVWDPHAEPSPQPVDLFAEGEEEAATDGDEEETAVGLTVEDSSEAGADEEGEPAGDGAQAEGNAETGADEI